MSIVLWYKRDLRVRDNAALAYCARLSRETGECVIHLYIVEPNYWALPDTSGRQWDFIRESLLELRQDLAEMGAPLIVRIGEAQDVFDSIHQDIKISHLVSHQEVGNQWTFDRDKRIASWCKENSITWKQGQHTPVMRSMNPSVDWEKERVAFLFHDTVKMPESIKRFDGLDAGDIPTSKDLGMFDSCPGRQKGGRRAGVDIYTSFLKERARGYRGAISSPMQAEIYCSRISPYLAYGTLSMREVYRGLKGRMEQDPSPQWKSSLKAFEQRVAGRDYFMQQFESNCWVEKESIDPFLDTVRPRCQNGDSKEKLDAWSKGQTGLPFIDACMRYLNQTGWLNFRMRAMVLSFASYQLWLDWRDTGTVLARLFTDYEPRIHWPMIQMQSGSNTHTVPRIYNPVKQAYDQDPTGAFVRAWCRELRDVPDTYVQEPWRWVAPNNALKNDYPNAFIDIKKINCSGS